MMNQTVSKKAAPHALGTNRQSVIVGADALGELRKSSENVGKEAAQKLLAELEV
jgi:RNA 3'-terminal phosphate cyclase